MSDGSSIYEAQSNHFIMPLSSFTFKTNTVGCTLSTSARCPFAVTATPATISIN